MNGLSGGVAACQPSSHLGQQPSSVGTSGDFDMVLETGRCSSRCGPNLTSDGRRKSTEKVERTPSTSRASKTMTPAEIFR